MSYRILIADDEPIIRADLKELLEELGYEVVAEAGDGLEALNLIEKIKPDVVILDIKMPKMDGIRVAGEIADRFPVIILTAYTERHLIEKARDSGVMAYLSKPFREGDLSPGIELAVTQFFRIYIDHEDQTASKIADTFIKSKGGKKWLKKLFSTT